MEITEMTKQAQETGAETPMAPTHDKVEFTLDEWEAELARAEQKGYTRGRNEAIEAELKRPGVYETASREADDAAAGIYAEEEKFLNYLRPSVWGE